MNSKIIILFLLVLIMSCKENVKPEVKEVVKLTVIDSISILKTEVKVNDSLLFEGLTKSFVLGKFNYRKDTLFTKVKGSHSSKLIYLQKEVYEAFTEMYNHAEQDGINLTIISGTRNFEAQKGIWNRKWKRYSKLNSKDRALKILEYSSMPSTSRHHWGTDMDLNNLNNSYFEKGKGLKEYEWLTANAFKFGFFQPYTSKENGRKGYNMEKWHWSYKPLSDVYLKFYNAKIGYDDVTGFSGAELAKDLDIIANYINGISKN